jgi:hypothetical protein
VGNLEYMEVPFFLQRKVPIPFRRTLSMEPQWNPCCHSKSMSSLRDIESKKISTQCGLRLARLPID